ncbi:MAG: Holliday junction resolvase RuvX [Candidatus Accumulibacter sp.]|nr:Holliday junction resolvase RuvX [Accumulibacter sp.]
MRDSPVPATGAVLAFDFGEKRIGVAVGEWQLRQAYPVTVITGESSSRRFAAIAALLAEWQPTSLVVGHPVSLDGEATVMTARCHRFGRQLLGRFKRPVTFVDERLSSAEATTRLREAGHNSRRAKNHLDAVAAQLILQSYFDGTVESVTPSAPSQQP